MKTLIVAAQYSDRWRQVCFVVAIFLIRDESYLDTLPQEHRPVFQDENPVAPAKIKVLKQMIEDRFPVSQGSLKTCSRQDQGPQADDRGQVPSQNRFPVSQGRLKTCSRQDQGPHSRWRGQVPSKSWASQNRFLVVIGEG